MTDFNSIDPLVWARRYGEAEAALHEMIARAQVEYGTPSTHMARVYQRLAFVRLEAGDAEGATPALALATECLGTMDPTSVPYAELKLLQGRVALARGQFQEAIEHINAANRVSSTLPSPSTFHGSVVLAMADVAQSAGDLQSYVSLINTAWKHSSGDDVISGWLRLTALLRLADAYLALEQPEAVRQLIAQARELAAQRFTAYPFVLEDTESIAREILSDLPDAP